MDYVASLVPLCITGVPLLGSSFRPFVRSWDSRRSSYLAIHMSSQVCLRALQSLISAVVSFLSHFPESIVSSMSSTYAHILYMLHVQRVLASPSECHVAYE